MDVTSEEIRSSRFQGTRHVYDRREVDAFLHRVAATLELYERKLTVTESHVDSLEKALELAQSRARSIQTREARITELEAALAASQHNYESAMAELEARADGGGAIGDQVADAERRAAATLAVAEEQAGRIKADASRIADEANEAADSVLAAARTEAEEILQSALLAQTAMLEEADQARANAEAEIAAELEAMRAAADAAVEEEHEMRAKADETEESYRTAAIRHAEEGAATATAAAAIAEERAAAAEAAQARAEDKLRAAEQALKKALAERERVEEAMAADSKEAAESDQVIAERERAETALAQLAAARSDLADVKSQLAELQEGSGDAVRDHEEEAAALRREVAQMRTAISNIQERFADASNLSSEELELAIALVDLDLHDVDQLVDLTTSKSSESQPDGDSVGGPDGSDNDGAGDSVRLKSKWAEAEAVPAGTLREGRADVVEPKRGVWPKTDEPAPNWRDKFGAAREVPAPAQPEEEPEALGFYERRLAGLRDRIRDVTPPE